MRYIHTSIISRHLASKGNNKILRTPPPHISSSEQILHRLTRPTNAQLRTTNLPSSDHTYIKSTPNNIPHHYAPYTTPTHTTDSIYSTASTLSPNDLRTGPTGVIEQLVRWIYEMAGGPKAGWSGSPYKQGSREWVDNNNIRWNMIQHWVHLRCAAICLAQ